MTVWGLNIHKGVQSEGGTCFCVSRIVFMLKQQCGDFLGIFIID